MKKIDLIMGMPIQIEIRDEDVSLSDFKKVFKYLRWVDSNFSPFKKESEVEKINEGKLRPQDYSPEMKEIWKMAEELKEKSKGYFNIKNPNGKIDPSGIVKGWAVKNAANILRLLGRKEFFVDAGGDAEIAGGPWTWGIRNPFNKSENIKILSLSDCGIATSGTYERGNHIYNPITGSFNIPDIVSLTVIGKDVYEADSFATPAFAMGVPGIEFIERLPGLEGYMINRAGIATMTSGFNRFLK